MNDIAEKLDTTSMAGYIGPARVLEIDEEKGLARVLLNCSENDREVFITWAQPAIPYPCELKWGETVLVAGQRSDDFYVIGLLRKGAPTPESRKSLVLKSGAKAEVTGDSEKLSVFSEDGGLLFEYDPDTGKTRVDVPPGDLEIINKSGNIDFISSKDIRFFSRQSIEMKSLQGISMAASNVLKKTLSSLKIGTRKMELRSPEIGIDARKGKMQIDDAQYSGKEFSGTVDSVKLLMERLEMTAENVIEKAVNMYKSVKELTQLTTGRMRTIVERTCQFKSRKAFLKAEEDFKIKGEKIHLG